MTLTATLIAIAVVSRAVFYLVPQVKPIAAVVIFRQFASVRKEGT